MSQQNAYEKFCVLPVEEFLPRIGSGIQEINGVQVRTGGVRLRTFTKGITCVWCDIKGTYFAVERVTGGKGHHEYNKWHVNLYAEDDDGRVVMMTSDHIMPASKGGSDSLENRQPMCEICNSLKGSHTNITLEEARARRAASKAAKQRRLDHRLANGLSARMINNIYLRKSRTLPPEVFERWKLLAEESYELQVLLNPTKSMRWYRALRRAIKAIRKNLKEQGA